MTAARHSKAQWSMGGNRFIPGGCHAIVAIATRNQGWDEMTQVPLTMSGLANAFVEAAPGRFTRQFFRPEYLLTGNDYRLRNRGPRNSYREN
ncbi:MAG: hypothetical protein Q7T45_22775 [Bradyrhizobium sp.]|uniref:hypothetical protein n=1 Tax=Bradyrhizobium sp. TaxID=376 RepID=UPI0027236018|nr:hypothetical protein [Bradyrhizobium sp.]MDO8400642.1 hypothetical protein [Bradyrhizobium sp.]